MRALLVAVGLVVIASACGRVPGGPLTGGEYKLYVAASTPPSQVNSQPLESVSVIDSYSHSLERSLPLGTASPDWSHLYTVNANKLVDVDPQTGATLHSVQLPGNFQLPPATITGMPGGLSQNGRWLVLQAFDKAANATPTGSHLLVVDTTYATKPLKIDLAGFFEFDAISNDGQRVYVIEYTNSSDNTYRVRVYEVTAGQLGAYTVLDKGGPSQPEPMAGTRISGVFSPDGQWLYSVYARKDQGAFVHALNLTQPYTYCLDLPGSGWSTSTKEFQWSLALSADGKHLYAANGAMGVVTEIDNLDGYTPTVLRTGKIGANAPSAASQVHDVNAKEFGASGAVLSPDGRTLVIAGSSGVAWVDTSTLRVTSRKLTGWTVWSMGASPDGRMVYAVKDSGDIAQLSFAPGLVGTTFNGAPGQPMALVRVEAVAGP